MWGREDHGGAGSVPFEISYLFAFAPLHDIKDLDGAVGGARGELLAVVVELHVVLRAEGRRR